MNKTISRTVCLMISFIVIITVSVIFITSEAEAATKPATVRMDTCKCQGSWINIYWKKAKGAKKYEVWVQEGDRPFKRVKTLTGKYYGYVRKVAARAIVRIKVRGINGKVKGSFSKIKTITEFKIAGIKGQTITEKHGPFEERVTVKKILIDHTLYGKTLDGISYAYEKDEAGRVIVRVGTGETTGETIMVDNNYCSFDFNCFFVTFNRLHYFDFKPRNDSGYSISWSIDGQKPVFQQGGSDVDSAECDALGNCYIQSGKFDIGRIPQFGYDSIVKGSSDSECKRMVMFPLLMGEEVDESKLESRNNGGLCDCIINGDRFSFIDYIQPDNFRDPHVMSENNLDGMINENGPVNEWFSIFDKAGNRKAEFLVIVPKL